VTPAAYTAARAVPSAATPVVLFSNSSGMGGMEAHVLQLARGLVARGLIVGAICSPDEGVRELRDGLRDAGAIVHVLPDRGRSALGVARRLTSLVATLGRYRGGVLHMHYGGYGGGELVQLAALVAGMKAVVRTEHVPPVPPISALGRARVHLRDRFLARVLYVSEQNRDEHLRSLGRDARRGVVIRSGLDFTQFSPAVSAAGVRAELDLPMDAPIVGTVSRLDEQRKGITDFLEMASRVRADLPAARFIVVGDGTLRPALERRAHELGLAESVVFAGARADIPRLLAAMSVFVMPSLWEGGPITLLEAMAMGRPVVSTPVGLAPDVVHDGETGLLAPLRDPAALARAVLELLRDPARASRLGSAGRVAVASAFSLETMVEAVARVYSEVAPRS
jgi:glycosyltransferase involved in cell wall biosynthesis